MEENKNLEETLSEEVSKEEIVTEQVTAEKVEEKEEYYFTAAELRKQKKRAEKRIKQAEKEEKLRKRNIGRMYNCSAVIAVFAGILQILMGFGKEDGMNSIMLGVSFICFGYFFYTMGKKAVKEMKKQMENR